MALSHVVLLVLAGLAAGTVNAIAGGGSLITFPALIATGLGQVAANVTNSVSVCPGYISSVYGTQSDLRELAADRGRRALVALIPTAIVGTAIGCALLLLTPESAFKFIVPFLVLGAAAVLAFQNRLRAIVGHPRTMSQRRQTITLQAMVGVGSIYGGYFGAALGVMLVAGLGLVLDESLARISALKNAISTIVGFGTVIAFSLFGPVNWVDVAIVAPATIVGGYAGARFARRLPPIVLRTLIVVLGTAVGIVLLIKAFG
ncbi:MAG TPA: sulfite exporter TauE/SafE family protein [Micromonosporaceae bacterium]|jgi:hypothetical protein